jgi:hypothetical protein
VDSSRQQADGSRQYLARIFFLGFLLPASRQSCFLNATRIVSGSEVIAVSCLGGKRIAERKFGSFRDENPVLLAPKIITSYRAIFATSQLIFDNHVSHLFHLIEFCVCALWLEIQDFCDTFLGLGAERIPAPGL